MTSLPLPAPPTGLPSPPHRPVSFHTLSTAEARRAQDHASSSLSAEKSLVTSRGEHPLGAETPVLMEDARLE